MNQNQAKNIFLPGSVISIRFPLYKHFAIVSDCFVDGMPTLISLSMRTGGVKEEAWSTVVGNSSYERSFIYGNEPAKTVLKRARSYINKDIKYNLLTFNCEHFVRLVHGLSVESKQVQQTIVGALAGTATCLLLPKLTMLRITLLVSTGAIASLKYSLNKI